jgi:hypothetical protein
VSFGLAGTSKGVPAFALGALDAAEHVKAKVLEGLPGISLPALESSHYNRFKFLKGSDQRC